MQKGFSILELLVVVATIMILLAITIPLFKNAILRAHIGAVAAESRIIHTAFKRHFLDHNAYPNASGSPAFELDTFEPLVAQGYYDGHITPKLLDETADAYDSPDDQGTNQEFWIELTLKVDPTVRFLIADSDDAPLSAGNYFDGIYLYRNGSLTPLTVPQ